MSEVGTLDDERQEPHPIRLVVTDDLRRSRLTVFLRALLAIPHVLWLALFATVVSVAAIVAWLVALALGRPPDGVRRLLVAFTRYLTHLHAYLYIAADPYPGFTGARGYPIDVEIEPAARQGRLTILFRLLLAIPALIVLWVLSQVAQIVAVLAWFYALFAGRLNKGMRDLIAYYLRYQAQTLGYVFILTRRYPSFADE